MAQQLLSLKDIRATTAFSGDAIDFEGWVFEAEAMARELGWEDLWMAARDEVDPIDVVRLNAGAVRIADNLYSLLAMRTRGKAQTIVKLCPRGNGFEALRRIYKEYRPSGDEPELSQLTTIVQPKWWHQAPHKDRNFNDVLLDWDQLIAAYELSSGESISNSLKCATILGFGPKPIEQMLRAANREVRKDHARMRQGITDFLLGQGAHSYVPRVQGGDDPMQVDAVVAAVAQLGKGEPCEKCGKPGHTKATCWHVIGFPPGKGGKGDQKGAKSSKSGKTEKTCHYCKKPGHFKKDCRKMIADKAKGEGGVKAIECMTDDDDWCMGISAYDCDAMAGGEDILLLDGGSDAHVATAEFGKHLPLSETAMRLRNVEQGSMVLDGQRDIPMVLGDIIPAQANFQVSPKTKRSLLSVGILYDGDYDLVVSKRWGTYLGREDKHGKYTKIELRRKKNTFGIPVKVCNTMTEARERASEAKQQGVVCAAADGDRLDDGHVDSRPAGCSASAGWDPTPCGMPRMEGFAGNHDPGRRHPTEASSSLTATKPDAMIAYQGAVLAPGSRVDLLRARLKELNQAIWGTKQQLWTRLSKAEAQKKADDERIKELRLRQEARASGHGSVPVTTLVVPKSPTREERELHDLTHCPPAAWCEECILGGGQSKPHDSVLADERSPQPLVLFDFGTTKAQGGDGKSVDDDFATSIVMVDRDTGMTEGTITGTKEADAHMVKAACGFIAQLGHKTCGLRCDNEPAALALQERVQAERKDRTILSNGSLMDSQSMGQAETAVRWWREKLRTFRYMVEGNYARKITPNHPLWPWLSHHAGFITARFRVRGDGQTAFFGCFGHNYTGEIVKFSETVLFKAPVSHTRQGAKKTRRHKGDSSWAKGIWVGKHDRSDDHYVLTENGRHRCRTIRRLEGSKRFDQEIFDKVVGSPWDTGAAAVPLMSVRRVVPTPAPTAPADVEVIGPAEVAEGVDPDMGVDIGGGHLAADIPVSEGSFGPHGDAMPITPPGSPRQAAAFPSPKRDAEVLGDGGDDNPKRFCGDVNMLEIETVDEKMDYTKLLNLPQLDLYNKSAFTDEEVMAGKGEGLDLLEEYKVFRVEPKSNSIGKKRVDTKWEIGLRGGKLKCRIVGREFNWLEERDDVFAPGSNAMFSRVVDFLQLKDDTDPDDPLVAFIADCTCAYYQAEEDEEFYVDPPPEWLALRKQAGLSLDVTWRLLKQLPGRRAAGNRWMKHVTIQFATLSLEKFPALPNFYKKEGTRVVIDTHMDDFHGMGKKSEVEALLPEMRKVLKLKASDCIITGKYVHLKRPRIKTESGTFVQANPKHVVNVINALGLANSNGAATPHLDEEQPEHSPLLKDGKEVTYRTCVGSLLYVCGDRLDINREVNLLSSALSNPTEFDMRRLVRVGKYLVKFPDLGVWLRRWPLGKFRQGVIILTGKSDTDWATCKATRRSMTCGIVEADDNQLGSYVRKHAIQTLSSGESEFCGLHSINVETILFKRLFEWLGFSVIWQGMTDSSAARGMAIREGVGKVRHMDLRVLWTQAAVAELGLKILKADGKFFAPDLGTKVHTAAEHQRLMQLAGICSFAGSDSLEEAQVSSVHKEPDMCKVLLAISRAIQDCCK